MFDRITPFVIRTHQDMLLEEARKYRELRVLRTTRPGVRERARRRLGNLLVIAGLRLLERYEPVLPSGPEVCPSTAGSSTARTYCSH